MRQPLRRLLQARPGSPVLRWKAELGQNYLRRYDPNGQVRDLSIAAQDTNGRRTNSRYLLIYAKPREIPWAVQYALNMSTFVGRLDLDADSEALDNYVNALVSDWRGQVSRPDTPVVWSVDHGADDITWLMARAVAGRLWKLFEADNDLTGRVRLAGNDATGASLADVLAQRQPGLVITTSHGMTGPLGDSATLTSQLGMPVDAQYAPLKLDDLKSWKPSGAIWYAHACCSAGSDGTSRYSGLLPADNPITRTLDGVAAGAGAIVAPLPRALLGSSEPLRAFVGHVEPTFDWTLRDPVTKQVLTHVLCESLHQELYQQDRRTPIGYALQRVYAEAGAFFGAVDKARDQINKNQPGGRDWALYRQLVAMDRQTLVVIGDPTVALPTLTNLE